MTVEDQIRDEELQYDINREVSKIPALSSDTIEKYILLVKIYCHLINNK